MNDTHLIRRIMIGLRMAIGVGAMLVPVTTGKLFGLDIRSGGVYMARLCAIRELILAYQLYQASDEEEFVKGDLLEGNNAYHCEKCNKKV